MLLAGPNGQGVVSTPASLCAQIVAPYPPAGQHRRGQSERQLRVELPQLRPCDGRRDHRAVSAGNAAAVSVADYLDLLRRRPGDRASASPTSRGSPTGAALFDRLAGAAARKPLVLLKGGATDGGARAAASHTGALAADDKVFDGECRAAGITRAATVEEAFEAAATFATQPAPRRTRTSSC